MWSVTPWKQKEKKNNYYFRIILGNTRRHGNGIFSVCVRRKGEDHTATLTSEQRGAAGHQSSW